MSLCSCLWKLQQAKYLKSWANSHNTEKELHSDINGILKYLIICFLLYGSEITRDRCYTIYLHSVRKDSEK